MAQWVNDVNGAVHICLFYTRFLEPSHPKGLNRDQCQPTRSVKNGPKRGGVGEMNDEDGQALTSFAGTRSCSHFAALAITIADICPHQQARLRADPSPTSERRKVRDRPRAAGQGSAECRQDGALRALALGGRGGEAGGLQAQRQAPRGSGQRDDPRRERAGNPQAHRLAQHIGRVDETKIGEGCVSLSQLGDGNHRLHFAMKAHFIEFQPSRPQRARLTLPPSPRKTGRGGFAQVPESAYQVEFEPSCLQAVLCCKGRASSQSWSTSTAPSARARRSTRCSRSRATSSAPTPPSRTRPRRSAS